MKFGFLTTFLVVAATSPLTLASNLRADVSRELTGGGGGGQEEDLDLSGYTFLISEIRESPKWCLTATETRTNGNVGFRPCDEEGRPPNQLWKLESDGTLRSGIQDGNRCVQQGYGGNVFEGVRIRLGVCDDNPNSKFTWEGGTTKYLKTPQDLCVTNRGPDPHTSDIIHVLTCMDRGDFKWNAVEDDREDDADPCADVTCENPDENCDIFDGLCKSNSDIVPCIAVIDESDNDSDASIEAKWSLFRQEYPSRPFCLLQPQTPSTGYTYLHRPASFVADPRTTFAIVNRDNGVLASASDWAEICGISALVAGGIDYVGLFVDQSGSMTLQTVQSSYDKFLADLTAANLTFRTVQNGREDWITPFRTVLN